MAGLSPSSSRSSNRSLRWKKPNHHRASLSLLSALVVFALVSLGLKNLIEHQNSSEPQRRQLRVLSRKNETNFKILARFSLHSGSLPVAHSSEPYLVRVDEETGAYMQTIQYGHDDHPLSRLVEVRDRRDAKHESTFFFVVPKANGGQMKAIMTNCYNLRRSEKVEDPESLTFIEGVLNIDTQTRNGLVNARAHNFIDLGLVDVYATSYFLEGMLLFRPDHKARVFTILQHPVLRVERLYQSRGSSLKKLLLLEYLESPHYVDNWVVRSLTNEKTGNLTEDHLKMAKGILARKFCVGIAEYFEETIKRLEIYYEWGKPNREGCVKSYLDNQHIEAGETAATIERGSHEWNFIASMDKYDLSLYYYGLELFAKQGTTMFMRPYVDDTGVPIDFSKWKKKKLRESLMGLMGFGTR